MVRRDTDYHSILLKGAVQQEEISIVNAHVLKIGVPSFIKQKLPDTKKNKETTKQSLWGTSIYSVTIRSTGEDINRGECQSRSTPLNQQTQKIIYKVFHPTK